MTSPPSRLARDPAGVPPTSFRAVQMVYAALAFGLLSFLVTVLVLQPGPQPAPPPTGSPAVPPASVDTTLWILLLTLWPVLTLFAIALPVFMNRKAAIEWSQQSTADPGWFAGRYNTAAILRGALLEGPGLFAIVIAFLSSDMRPLVLGGASIILLAVTFPTRAGFARFAERTTGGRAVDGALPSVHADPRRNPG